MTVRKSQIQPVPTSSFKSGAVEIRRKIVRVENRFPRPLIDTGRALTTFPQRSMREEALMPVTPNDQQSRRLQQFHDFRSDPGGSVHEVPSGSANGRYCTSGEISPHSNLVQSGSKYGFSGEGMNPLRNWVDAGGGRFGRQIRLLFPSVGQEREKVRRREVRRVNLGEKPLHGFDNSPTLSGRRTAAKHTLHSIKCKVHFSLLS